MVEKHIPHSSLPVAFTQNTLYSCILYVLMAKYFQCREIVVEDLTRRVVVLFTFSVHRFSPQLSVSLAVIIKKTTHDGNASLSVTPPHHVVVRRHTHTCYTCDWLGRKCKCFFLRLHRFTSFFVVFIFFCC